MTMVSAALMRNLIMFGTATPRITRTTAMTTNNSMSERPFMSLFDGMGDEAWNGFSLRKGPVPGIFSRDSKAGVEIRLYAARTSVRATSAI